VISLNDESSDSSDSTVKSPGFVITTTSSTHENPSTVIRSTELFGNLDKFLHAARKASEVRLCLF
jgi:hypothetical protein